MFLTNPVSFLETFKKRDVSEDILWMVEEPNQLMKEMFMIIPLKKEHLVTNIHIWVPIDMFMIIPCYHVLPICANCCRISSNGRTGGTPQRISTCDCSAKSCACCSAAMVLGSTAVSPRDMPCERWGCTGWCEPYLMSPHGPVTKGFASCFSSVSKCIYIHIYVYINMIKYVYV